jgi:hypothetical protein
MPSPCSWRLVFSASAPNSHLNPRYLTPYPPTHPTPHSLTLQAFQARTARAPEQVLRYCFQPGAAPLWPSHTHRPEPGDIPLCTHCGAQRQFEFQVGACWVCKAFLCTSTRTAVSAGRQFRASGYWREVGSFELFWGLTSVVCECGRYVCGCRQGLPDSGLWQMMDVEFFTLT